MKKERFDCTMVGMFGKTGAGERSLRNPQRNDSISLIRFVALIFIVACHIMQKLELELAWWFNVGVQIFLCMSGFLYGQKDVGETCSFYLRRFRKILIPYFIVFIPYGILQFLFAREVFTWNRFIKGLFVNSTLKGAGHLWFVHTILICYVLVPLLAAFRDQYVKSRKSYILFLLLSAAIAAVFFRYFNQFYKPAWIVCFVIGFALGMDREHTYISGKTLLAIFGLAALVGNGIQIYFSYIAHRQFARFEDFCDCNHVMLGVFLFLMMKRVFDRLQLRRLAGLLSFTDRYSYEIYLTHHLIILGPFSLMSMTSLLWLNIVLIFIITTALAFAVNQLSGIIERRVFLRKADTK